MSDKNISDGRFGRIFFSLLLVGVALTIVLFIFTNVIGGPSRNKLSKVQKTLNDTQVPKRVEPGAKNIGEQVTTTLAPQVSNKASVGAPRGKTTYETACAACHAEGVAGAPKLGDTAAWKIRIAKGNNTLYKHAIEGFRGKAGFMPAKGGAINVSDAQVKAAVDYMVATAK